MLKGADLTALTARVAAFPIREVWRWAFLVADATNALLARMPGPSAFAFLVVAEGMWGDLVSRFGDRKWKSMYRKGGAVANSAVAESLTWSWESLVAAQEVISKDVRRSYDEPIDSAPTSRHGLLHGRIAGALESHHAMKAFTLVEGIVEHAQVALTTLPPEELAVPPWMAE